jgi:dipeptide/tripeptide permease
MSDASAAHKTASQLMADYFRNFGVLRETRREYWGIQIINLLDCAFYFGMLEICTLFLSDDLGMTDRGAGRTYTVLTASVTLLLTVSGLFCDWLGIRRSLRISMWWMLVLRLAMLPVALLPGVPHRGILAVVVIGLMAPPMAAIQTIFQSATQRYTTPRSRGAGFNLWYLFMNAGATLGGFAVDAIRLVLHVPNVHIFTVGVVTAALCLIVGESMVRKEEQLRMPGEPDTSSDQVEHKKPLAILREVIREPALRRLIVLIALTLGVRSIYVCNFVLMPKYWVRTIGPNATIGLLNNINPVGIVIGLILFIPFANKFRVVNMLVFGSIVSALSLVPMAMPWQLFSADVAWAHYLMAIVCMAILTVGEVLWSPKLYEYTAAIAPKGQEGTYLGFSMIPYFLAKTVVSWFSGDWLMRWSPETVTVHGAAVPLKQALIANEVNYWHSPAAMWFWIGLVSLAGCLAAVPLRNWFARGARMAAPPPAPA